MTYNCDNKEANSTLSLPNISILKACVFAPLYESTVEKGLIFLMRYDNI